jgi:AraC-like DNA-binding protein
VWVSANIKNSCDNGPRNSPVVDAVTLQALLRARARLDREYQEPVSVRAIAAGTGFSTAHFIRMFSAVYGETPGAYRTRRRIERACDLLRSVNLTVTEICFAVGFTSLGSFSSAFSRITGRPPTSYRAEASRQGGPAPIPGCFALRWRTGLAAPAHADEPVTFEEAPIAGQAYSGASPGQAREDTK